MNKDILCRWVWIALCSVPLDFQFFGVIDTRGFETFRFEETDGKVGKALYVFADDFTIGTSSSVISSDDFEVGDSSAWSVTVP